MLAPHIPYVGVGIKHTKASEEKLYICTIVIHWKAMLCPAKMSRPLNTYPYPTKYKQMTLFFTWNVMEEQLKHQKHIRKAKIMKHYVTKMYYIFFPDDLLVHIEWIIRDNNNCTPFRTTLAYR